MDRVVPCVGFRIHHQFYTHGPNSAEVEWGSMERVILSLGAGWVSGSVKDQVYDRCSGQGLGEE